MAYRDRPLDCPRCGLGLGREGTRDIWRCHKCHGALIGVEEVIRELVAIAPDLAPATRQAVDLVTRERRATEPALLCSSCGRRMTPVFLGGEDVDRCMFDQLIWFDASEHETVLDTANAQHRARSRSWLVRLFDLSPR
jgi:Zn-finger nucleic acid-binding protein